MKNIAILSILIASICLATPLKATTLFLEDWGVSPGTWTPSSAPSNTDWIVEDFTGSGPGYVGPGWGGQPFDAEAAYIATDGYRVYLAVVTGMPQAGAKDYWRYDNPAYTAHDWNQRLEKYWYDPGDIGIDINNDGIYEFAITTRATSVNSSHTPTPGAGLLLSGNLLWENPRAWATETRYTNWGGASDPWAVKAYDNAIDLGSNFSYTAFGTEHYAIEAILDASLLGLKNGDIFSLHWTMECGNDNLNLSHQANVVPEPSTFLLLCSGIGGVFLYRKIRRHYNL